MRVKKTAIVGARFSLIRLFRIIVLQEKDTLTAAWLPSGIKHYIILHSVGKNQTYAHPKQFNSWNYDPTATTSPNPGASDRTKVNKA